MVAPIVGPLVTEIGGSGDPSYYSYTARYRQSKPFNLALPYKRHVGVTTVKIGLAPGNARTWGTQGYIGDRPNWPDLQAKSYDKLKDEISARAALSVSLIEGRQAIGMIAQRTGQLLSFARKLRRLDLAGAARELNLAVTPKGASRKKSFAGNWLEYQLGWVPMVMDIGNAVEVVQSPLKEQYARGAKSGLIPMLNLQTPQNLVRDVTGDWIEWEFRETVTFSRQIFAQGCQVAVNNPNLWLANQLGFVNPATVAWEVIPFSFVVDWFINVEQFLSSGTDFLGLTVQNPWRTYHMMGTYEYYFRRKYKYWNSQQGYWYSTDLRQHINTFSHTDRAQGLVGPSLYFRPLKVPSWKRALTATSLLVQQLAKR